MSVATLTGRDFTKSVLGSSGLVVAAFRSGSCLVSQEMSATVEAIAKGYDRRCRVVSVDLDEDAEGIRQRFDITRLPITMLFEDGVVKDFIGGRSSAESLGEMIDRRLRPVLDVGELTFDREVTQATRPVLVHFAARWCAASEALGPFVEEVARGFQGKIRVARVEFGPRTERLCARFGVLRVPTLLLFYGGQVVDTIYGSLGADVAHAEGESTPAEKIAEMVERIT